MNDELQGQGIPGGQDGELPLVDDPDVDGADEADDAGPGDPSPKTDVPEEDDPDAPAPA